jgi:(p)ppGpp synthase/HD superfamily hydrolase
MKTLSEQAKDYAIECHSSTNHLYDNQPYQVHLEMVVSVMEQFKHLIPVQDHDLVRASCWVHDVIEDCRQTYNDVKSVCGVEVAEIAYALTNEKGKTRKDRANDTYYVGIMRVKYAPFVKLCDRIANMTYSKSSGSGMFEMYRKESEAFLSKLNVWEYQDMAHYIGVEF